MAVQDLANLIAQSRQGLGPVGQTTPRVMQGGGTYKKTTKGSPAADVMGYQSGQVVGQLISQELMKRQPEYIRGQAFQAREVFNAMPPDAQKNIIIKPEVQKKFQEYEKVAPELFVDAGDTFQDPAYAGYKMFASTTEAMQKRAEVKRTQALTKGTEATTEATKAQTKAIQGQERRAQQTQPLEMEALRARTAATRGQERRAEEMHPLEMDMMRAQTALYIARRDKALSSEGSGGFSEVFKTRQAMDDNLVGQFSKMMVDPETYAIKDVQATASMVNSMGYAQLPGIGVPIPAAVTEPQAIQWVNKSINEAFMAAFKDPEMDPRKAQQLYNESFRLYQNTYGFLLLPEVSEQVPGIDQYVDPDILAKLAYLEYVANYESMSDEERESARRKLRQNFPFPEFEESQGVIGSFLNVFRRKEAAGDLEQSTIDQTGQRFKIGQ